MTAFAIKFERRSIAIASDTIAYVPDKRQAKPVGFVNKVAVFPHLRAALFARGQMQILGSAAADIAMRPDLFSIEDAATRLPEALADISECYCDQHGLDDWRTLALAEVVFTGWSAAEGRMRLWLYNSYENYRPQDDGGAFYGRLLTMPRLSDRQLPPRLDRLPVADALVAAMQAERELFAEHPETVGGAIIGGEIVLTDINPQRVSQRIVHQFADHNAVRHAAAAVAGRVLREGAPDISDAISRVGEAVDAADLGGQSRQQRRAAEKAAKKAARRAA
jgi:hypothetical protein